MHRVPVLHRLILTGRTGTGRSVQVYIVVWSIQWLLWLTTQIHRADRRLYSRRETPEVVCVHKYTSTFVCVWSHMSILFWLGSELESMIIVTTIIGVFLAALLEMDTKHTELCVVDTQLNVIHCHLLLLACAYSSPWFPAVNLFVFRFSTSTIINSPD